MGGNREGVGGAKVAVAESPSNDKSGAEGLEAGEHGGDVGVVLRAEQADGGVVAQHKPNFGKAFSFLDEGGGAG